MQPYMYKRPDSSNWQFRRPVPLHLQDALGQPFITGSLRTPDYKEAARRARQRAAETDDLFAETEAKLKAAQDGGAESEAAPCLEGESDGRQKRLERHMVPQLLERYRTAMLILPEAHRRNNKDTESLAVERAQFEAERQALTDACALEDVEYAEENAETVLETEGFDLEQVTPELRRFFTLELMHADLAVIKEQLARLNGIKVPEPEWVAAPGEGDSWDHYINFWVDERHPEPKTADECRSQIKRLRKFTGDKAPVELTPDDLRNFAFHLEKNDGLSRSRIKTIFALLRPVLETNIKSGRTMLKANPFADVKISVSPKDREEIQPFEPEHIRLLLKTEVFTAGKRPAKGGRDAAFWLPLLALFGGEREEELGQLSVRDVVTQNGRLFLRITDLADEQGVKNEVSRRHVPVHAELMKIGFGRYVETVRAAGKDRLFPDLKPNKYDVLTAQFSTWFNEYLDRYVIDDVRYNFHSFRHFFQERAGWSGLKDYAIDGILGHQPEGMGGRYGKKRAGRRVFDPMQLAEGMDQYRIDDVDFSPLYGAY
ncbi:hypothetical protein WS62_29520 [Burkholderia sp. ABCPW 14]|nr:hypothetical protein WS62_29520 [Burkholderia sp. ABCPW 14]